MSDECEMMMRDVDYVTVSMSNECEMMKDVVYVSESEDGVEPQPSTSDTQLHADGDCRKQKLLQRAPVVSYGTDLYFWGDNFELPLITR